MMIELDRQLYHDRRYWVIRRIQDIVFSMIAIVLLCPLMIVVALCIFIDDPKGSPIFCQVRCGRDGKTFRLYKFRSMCVNAEQMLDGLRDENEADGPAFKMKNDPRITRIGRFIRKTSIDELPQLFNVLKGDMSIVGPRPPLPAEVEQYNEYQRQRLYVTPGLTCYWQIQPNRNDVKFDDWIELDIKYIKERSLRNDWKIMLKTVKVVVTKQGM
ncbi:MAG: sugar transferase [Lachnospiraceae bacterium]|nr:sugar transferase [Lachnospiraceae bacterium]